MFGGAKNKNKEEANKLKREMAKIYREAVSIIKELCKIFEMDQTYIDTLVNNKSVEMRNYNIDQLYQYNKINSRESVYLKKFFECLAIIEESLRHVGMNPGANVEATLTEKTKGVLGFLKNAITSFGKGALDLLGGKNEGEIESFETENISGAPGSGISNLSEENGEFAPDRIPGAEGSGVGVKRSSKGVKATGKLVKNPLLTGADKEVDQISIAVKQLEAAMESNNHLATIENLLKSYIDSSIEKMIEEEKEKNKKENADTDVMKRKQESEPGLSDSSKEVGEEPGAVANAIKNVSGSAGKGSGAGAGSGSGLSGGVGEFIKNNAGDLTELGVKIATGG